MRYKRALLPLVFILYFILPTANTDWIKCMEKSGSAAVVKVLDTLFIGSRYLIY